jgi:glycosyltransferase involved in cell wall biosynthesis
MTDAIITASICTYDRYDLLPQTIDSLLIQNLPPDRYRILVIDNSPDHARAREYGSKCAAAAANLTYVVVDTPGVANARNVAARLCATPYLAFVDDDAVAEADWLAEILAVFERFGDRAVAVGGRIDPIWVEPRPPWVHDVLLGYLSIVNYGDETRPAGAEEWFAATNLAFRTDAVLANGGFSTRLGRVGSGIPLISNEEIQLIERIRASGGDVIYAANAKVRHRIEPKRLTHGWFRRRAAWQVVSDFMMDPAKFGDWAQLYWPGVRQYFNMLPQDLHTVRGLFHDTEDPEVFNRQCSAVYMIASMMLAGVADAPR